MADDVQDQVGQGPMEEMLSIGEAADYIGVSVDTLRRWSKKGRVTTYRSPGGHRYYKKKDLMSLFDAKYSRDEPTIRRSQEEIEEEKQIESANTEVLEQTNQPEQVEVEVKTDETSQFNLDTDEMNIPQMQPIRVISQVEDHQNLTVPDQMPPPPPEITSYTHIEIDRVVVDEIETSDLNETTQPLAQTDHTQDNIHEELEQRTESEVITIEQTQKIEDDQFTSPPIPVRKPEDKNIEVKVEEVEKDNTESFDDEDEVRQERVQRTPDKDTMAPIPLSQPMAAKEPAPSAPIRHEVVENKTEKPEEIKVVKVDEKDDYRRDEIPEKVQVEKTHKEIKPEKTEPAPKPVQKQVDRPERSIIEPEHIDITKVNKLIHTEDDSWFTRNKTNILIGFAVFLLIDIILFIIWLTTNRMLSPLP